MSKEEGLRTNDAEEERVVDELPLDRVRGADSWNRLDEGKAGLDVQQRSAAKNGGEESEDAERPSEADGG